MDRESVSSSGGDRQLPRSSITSNMDNMIKVAVVKEGEQNLLTSLDQNRPLTAIINDICKQWNYTDYENFALQNKDKKTFITDQNRHEIKMGEILELTDSPRRTAELSLAKLKGDQSSEKTKALRELSVVSRDITFAQEFILLQGLEVIVDIVVAGKFEGEPLTHTLKSFLQLMEHGIVSWDVIESDFVRKVAALVSFDNKAYSSQVLSAMEILECVLLHSSGMYSTIEQLVTVQSVGLHLQSLDPDIKKNCIALINAMLLKADPVKKNKLIDVIRTGALRTTILTQVMRSEVVGPAMAHELHVLQSHILNQLEHKYNTPADPANQETMAKLEELLKTAFQLDMDPNLTVSRRSGNPSKDFRKLGFTNCSKPIEDFMVAPPGLLTLDNLSYFAKKQSEGYTKIVLENSVRGDDHDCPITRAAIALTHKLCVILRVGEEPSEESQTYYPMFFCHDQPFEELFCICMQALNKTWKDMRATVPDFDKVLEVVQEQITRSLQLPNPPRSFDIFRNKLNSLSYQQIRQIWESDRQIREEYESQAQPIVDLRKQIEPEINVLIKQQRINYLIAGAMFMKFGPSGKRKKDKWWYCRLSANQKAFHYGHCEENETDPPIESLSNKLAISDIKDFVVGKDCPHMEKERESRKCQLAFAMLTDTQEPLSFVASDEKQFNIWTDGLNALLGRPMMSAQKQADMDILMAMEIKLRLLDIEGTRIPTEPPPIPKPPSNYNFYYKS